MYQPISTLSEFRCTKAPPVRHTTPTFNPDVVLWQKRARGKNTARCTAISCDLRPVPQRRELLARSARPQTPSTPPEKGWDSQRECPLVGIHSMWFASTTVFCSHFYRSFFCGQRITCTAFALGMLQTRRNVWRGEHVGRHRALQKHHRKFLGRRSGRSE